MGARSDKCVLPRSPGPRPSAAGSYTHPRIGCPAMRPDVAGGKRAPARAVSTPPYAISLCAACSTARRARPVRTCSAALSRVRGDTTAAARCGRRLSGDTAGNGASGSCSALGCPCASATPISAGRPRFLRPCPDRAAPTGNPFAIRRVCHPTNCSAVKPPRSTCAYACSMLGAVGRPRRLPPRHFPANARAGGPRGPRAQAPRRAP